MHRSRSGTDLCGVVTTALVAIAVGIGSDSYVQARDKAKPVFASKVMSSGLVEVDVPLAGAKGLWLVVSDGGDGYGCDWADWIEPRFIGEDGEETRLTGLRWKSARAGWGQVRKNKNAGGGALRVGDLAVEDGIGTHAPSVIHFEIPAGAKRFRARAGLDRGGTDQSCGATVRFLVFTQPPPERVGRRAGAAGALEPAEAAETLEPANGLETVLYAHEPMVVNPTNLDIDSRGRVWVTEGVNYRRWRNLKPEGDRIVILDDTDGDGRADHSKVFYQGRDIDSALGICVLGERIFVSRSPHVFVFTDHDGDDRPDEKKVLFSGIGGEQHDHGAHAFVFGPDGRLYFNFGNSGTRLLDGAGATVVDRAGNPILANGKPYRQGMVFRCALDGSNVETLGHNFRNNYEVAIDSFGTLWQSDNDDDGNRGVRINYVMEYGNFGYREERTGAGWNAKRTNIEPDTPSRHWHQNDPGVVPNLLQTGSGSPTGICVYEGDLLPAVYRGQMIHCEPGHNVVRAYPVVRSGAGYAANIADVVSSRDKWFRPADVCVAADGSLFVVDWYDAGVGGHNMADNEPGTMRGRIYRVAPSGHRRVRPPVELDSIDGALAALSSPNHARRFLGYRSLYEKGESAKPALRRLWGGTNRRLRARALYLLARLEGPGTRMIDAALASADADLQVAAIRVARAIGAELLPILELASTSSSAALRREAAIALRHDNSARAPEIWARLAARHEAGDRWSVEALGIGAARRESEFLAAWLAKVGDGWKLPAGREIVWRSRAPEALPLLAELILDPTGSDGDRLRFLRALDFHASVPDEIYVALLGSSDDRVVELAAARLKGFDPAKNDEHAKLVRTLAEKSQGTARIIGLARKFDLRDRAGDVVEALARYGATAAGGSGARWLLEIGEAERLKTAAGEGDDAAAIGVIQALGSAADPRAVGLLAFVVTDEERSAAVLGQAARALVRSKNGASALLRQARYDRVPEAIRPLAGWLLSNVVWDDIRQAAREVLPPPAASGKDPLPPIAELAKRSGDAARGRAVFVEHCASCHRAGDAGVDFGPGLSDIGTKLGKDALYQSILDPNAGVSFDYEGTLVVLESGDEVAGIVVSETETELALRIQGGTTSTLAKEELITRQKLTTSIMPSGLEAAMTEEQLVDLVEFLTQLRVASSSP